MKTKSYIHALDNLDVSNVYITSDIHGYHKNICYGISTWKEKHGCRNFDCQYQMTDTICDNINSVVKPTDTLISVGDWSFGDLSNVYKLREKINCENIIHILGNHDKHIRYMMYNSSNNIFSHIDNYVELRVGPTLVCISHYAQRVWNENGRGAINLYGHSHGSLAGIGRGCDIGLDTNGLMPYNLGELVKEMSSWEIVALDHHSDTTNYN